MFFEPPRSQYDLSFSLFGIPVRVHPMFWLVSILLGANLQKPQLVLLWVIAVFFAVVVHEMGHALAVRAYGWRPHIVLYSFGGLAVYQPTYRTAWSQTLISLAGPAAGFVLGAIVGAIAIYFDGVLYPTYVQFGIESPLGENAMLILNFLWFITIWWGAVNLLPILPLDGGHVSQQFFQRIRPRDGLQWALILSVIASGGVAAYSGIYRKDLYMAFMFAYLAYTNYQTLQYVRQGQQM